MEEKIGGYDAKLTPRTRAMREEALASVEGAQKAKEDFYPEDIALAKEIFDSINLKELKSVFFDYLKKSGVPVENANEEALEKFFSLRIEGATAEYSALRNQIALSTLAEDFLRAKKQKSEQIPIPSELLMEMQLLIIHEMCHALGRVRIFSEQFDSDKSVLTEQVGYVTRKSQYNEHSDGPLKSTITSFEAFNEGVTQRLAEEIFLEYQRRSGNSGPARKFLGESIRENAGGAEGTWRYSAYENQVNVMCDAIAQYVGVPEEEVWKSIKRGYFEKPELYNEETVQLFRETFGEDFPERYSRLSNDTYMRNLAKFHDQYNFPRTWEYAEKWLRHLGIVKE